MNLTNFRVTFLIFQLIARKCLAKMMIKIPKPEDSSGSMAAVVQILKSCHGERANAIGFAGNSAGEIFAALSPEGYFSGVLLGNTGKTMDDVPVPITSKYKLQIFVITTSSPMELEGILMNIKNSQWWNHMAYFYILEGRTDTKTNTESCLRAYEILQTAWRMNILEAKFFCTHSKKGPLIYHFNPYTKNAPEPWKLDQIYGGKNDHPWTLLVRKYLKDRDICENINFDKTKDIGGYEVRATTLKKMWYMDIDMDKTGVDSIGGAGGDIMQSIFRAMNATAKLMVHEEHEMLGSADHKGKASGVLAEIVNGISDIGLIDWDLMTVGNLTTIYPYYCTGLSIMTKGKDHVINFMDILDAIDSKCRIGMCLVFFMTFIYFKYFRRETSMTATLNIIRLICNVPFTKLPKRQGPRVYLTSIFMSMIVIQALYQAKLASLLANRESSKNVETISDLAQSNHTIYSNHRYSEAVNSQGFGDRHVGTVKYNCTKYVLHKSSAACVWSWPLLVLEAARTKLHVSKEFIATAYDTWVIRDDWPLEQRVNKIVQRLVEGNLIRYMFNNIIAGPLRNHDNNYHHKDNTFKDVTLADLRFAFVILGVGWACAGITFIIEIIIGRGRFRKIQPKREMKRHFIA